MTNPQRVNQLALRSQMFLTVLAGASAPVLLFLSLIQPSRILAQAGGAVPAYNEASVKSSHAVDKQSHLEVRPDGVTDLNATVRELIEFAYGVQSDQVSGIDDWINSDRFDVQARWTPATNTQAAALPAPPPAAGGPAIQPAPAIHLPPGQVQTAIRAILADKFHLQLQHNSKVLPVYDLVVASSGAKLTKTPSAPSPIAPPATPPGEPIVSLRTKTGNGQGELTMNGPVGALAGFLSEQVGRQVRDKTGLKGIYDVNLQWKSNQSATESISTALEEQLGLKLEPQQGPVETLFVAHILKPSEN